ncbi:MAG: hypothetical protein V1494_02225 [Candidatus Diapherotrites archaeon]
MQRILKENLVKNTLLIVILAFLYFPINDYLLNSGLALDKDLAGNFLIAMGIVAVTACFGNFSFTYEKINNENTFQRYFAHLTTGLLMLVIGVSIIFTGILMSFIIGSFIVINFSLIALYLACIGYDFWDLLRMHNA